MNQELQQIPNQSLHSTNETLKQKRPYNKISQEIRAQIVHALTVQKLPLQTVAELFQTKACTCKAILLTYEHEGRMEKKTNRRERVEISSTIRLLIQDPLCRHNQEFVNVKLSKMYTEEKHLSGKEQGQLQNKLQQELLHQLSELQSNCYLVQQTINCSSSNDEKAPGNIARGINMSIHLISSKIKESEIKVENKFLKKQQKLQSIGQQEELIKIEEGKSNVFQEKFQQLNPEIEKKHRNEINENYARIRQFIESVNLKAQSNPQLLVQLNYLSNETIIQTSVKQRLNQKEHQVQILKQAITNHLKQFFQLH